MSAEDAEKRKSFWKILGQKSILSSYGLSLEA